MANKKSRKTGKNNAGAKTGPDKIQEKSVKKANNTKKVPAEYKRFLTCLRRAIIPKSVMHDYVQQRVSNKMDKYENLFVTGHYESEPSEKSIQLNESERLDEQTQKHGTSWSNASSDASLATLYSI